jgi:membrane associated rhomboid family serine protease
MTNPWAQPEPQREPFFKLPGIILALLGVMIAVHAWLSLSGPATQAWAISTFAFIPARYAAGGAAHFGGGVPGLIWPFFTHLFLHGNLTHIGFNSLWLMAMGTPVARRLGGLAFLPFFLVCGALGAAMHLAFNLGSSVPVIGASGAISGCMGAALRIMFSPDAHDFSMRSYGIGTPASLFDRRIIVVTIIWFGINYLFGSGLVPLPGTGGAGIAWEAHIGGYLAGLVLLPLFDRRSNLEQPQTEL